MRVHGNHPLGALSSVFFNGEELIGCCILADEYTGMVECYIRDADGRFILGEDGELKTEQRFGDVRIQLPNEAMTFFDWAEPA